MSLFCSGLAAIILATDKISPLTQPPTLRGSNQKGEKGGSCPIRDGEVEARGRDSLMDPGMGSGSRPRRKSLTRNSTIPRP